jgi:hypothetical protein
MSLIEPILPGKNRDEFARRHDTDFAYEIPGLARFRVNVFMDRKGSGAVFRVVPLKMHSPYDHGGLDGGPHHRPEKAYAKAVDKAGFEAALTRGRRHEASHDGSRGRLKQSRRRV